MKKFVISIFIFALTMLCANAHDIFSSKISAAKAASLMPDFKNASCKFNQIKYLKASKAELTSGGNFQFLKENGVVFETTYPIKTTTDYTADKNKRISAIVKAIINKNYTYLEKNFELFFEQSGAENWLLALKPTTGGQLKGELSNIIIYCTTKNNTGYIKKMIIDTTNTRTTINFSECR